jgi:ubiquinol-cytochrome c reductase cytochrome c subunit
MRALVRRTFLRGVGRRLPVAVQMTIALVAVGLALTISASPGAAQQEGEGTPGPRLPGSAGPTVPGGQVARGRALFLAGCAICHGADATGIAERGPSLVGVGPGAADFYLSTGRMPLARPDIQPHREEPLYSARDRRALRAYIGSLGDAGVPVPDVHPERGDLAEGQRLFTEHCSGCHQVMGEGGMTTGAYVPALKDATPAQIEEAIRIGPYLMPHWNERAISDRDVDSIARYVVEVVQRPPDAGGWGIGHIGPVTEGLVAWFLLGLSAVLVVRIIGERTTR